MILVDSDVLIAHLRGVRSARDWLVRCRQETGRIATSVVSIAEIAGGMRSEERRDVSRLFSSLDVLPVSERVGWRASEFIRTYRRSHTGIGLGDFLVAATADVNGLDLATLNVKHFPMFARLEPPFDFA
ncbi:MAG: type II toxin-antitoxin system VapC family toxin [Nocardioidaceae bacterium]